MSVKSKAGSPPLPARVKKTMKGLDITLDVFKKVGKSCDFLLMSVNAFTNNNNLSSLENQYISSYKGDLICLSTLSNYKNKRHKLFGKQ